MADDARSGGQSMKVAIVPVTPYQQNCSILFCETTRRAAIVDPGGDLDQIEDALNSLGAMPQKIFLTHGHVDHCGGTGELAAKLNLPVEGPHRDDQFLLDDAPSKSVRMGFRPALPFTPDRWLQGGDTVRFGEIELEVRHCPGHTPGHVIFFLRQQRIAWVGDVLFRGSIGRSDFPRGDHDTLIRSIREQLWPLGDDVTFVPGHGPTSTFGYERQTNPFVADGA